MPRILDLEAEHQADLDILVESKEDAARARIRELYQDPDERDADLWAYFEADVNLVIEDFEETPIVERDSEYRDLFEAMVIATRMQTWFEQYSGGYLEKIERAGRQIAEEARRMSTAELSAAAKQGIGKGNISAAKERKLAALEGKDNDSGKI